MILQEIGDKRYQCSRTAIAETSKTLTLQHPIINYFTSKSISLKINFTNIHQSIHWTEYSKQAYTDTHWVTVRKGYRCSLLLIKMPFFAKLLVKLPIVSIFENQIDALRVMKPTVETKHVLVLQAELNLHLPPQLVVNSVLLKLFLKNNLQCNHEFTLQKPNKWKIIIITQICSVIFIVQFEDSKVLENLICLGDLKFVRRMKPWLLWRRRLCRICLFREAFRSRSRWGTILV